MIRSALVSKVREFGRFNTAVNKTVIETNLDEAAKQFSRDTHIILKTVTKVIEEKFSLGTNEAFKLTIGTAGGGYLVNAVDVVLGAAQNDVTGATLASALQAIVQGTGVGATATTVSYSQSTKKFTLTASAESSVTSISVAPPAAPQTYYDASYKLFGILVSGSIAASAYTGAAAPYCQAEMKLPSDFLEMDEVIYRDEYYRPLQPEIYRWRNDTDGDPDFFSVYAQASGDYIRFTAHPQTIDTRVELRYAYKPSAIATGSAGDALSYPFNASYDLALIFYAVYLTKLGGTPEELQGAFTFKALYNEAKEQAEIDIAAQTGGGYDLTQRGRQGL